MIHFHRSYYLCKTSKGSMCVFLYLFRDGCTWFFDELHKHNIPLLIFSAGLGDIISEVISFQSELYDNMKIVSNFLQFDDAVCSLLLFLLPCLSFLLSLYFFFFLVSLCFCCFLFLFVLLLFWMLSFFIVIYLKEMTRCWEHTRTVLLDSVVYTHSFTVISQSANSNYQSI